jgi:hypothetical protein
MIIIVGGMGIRFTSTTPAQHARRRRKDKKLKSQKATRWVESSGSKNNVEGEHQFSLTLDCIKSLVTSATDGTSILDSECNSNFLSATVPCTNKQISHIPLNVNMPNGTAIQSSITIDFLLNNVPCDTRKAHVLTGVGQLCDSGCDVMFTWEKVEVMKDGKCAMSGLRDPQSRLWRVNLKEDAKLACKSECKHVYETAIINS